MSLRELTGSQRYSQRLLDAEETKSEPMWPSGIQRPEGTQYSTSAHRALPFLFAPDALRSSATGSTRRSGMKTLLAFIGALAILCVIVAAGFFFGGFYNVAATVDDPPSVKSALAYIRQASIMRHATDAPPSSLDDPAMVQAGARAFSERGCAGCHGAPGVNWAKFSEGLRPYPPDLKELVDQRKPQELFWVIKHGIHMTGMPSFGLIEVPDREIWTIVAFVKKLPSVSEADFKAWSAKP
jgi:mono/diheme cytochrome c family protein